MARYLTAQLPGCGGRFRQSPEDFLVEEIPLYLPCGEGEHLYLTVEKRGISTFEMLQRLARALGVKERDIGYAGLKDAQAVARQTVSLTGVAPAQATALELDGIKVLAAQRHRNKLRLGHLAGNRFRLRVRGTTPDALERALDILHVLADIGVPNRFGAQRYGAFGTTHHIGRAMVTGDFGAAAQLIVGDPETIRQPRWQEAAKAYAAGDLRGALALLPGRCRDERALLQGLLAGRDVRTAVLALPRKLLRLYLSAWQSALFDRLLEMRLDSLDRLWLGDLAYKHANGACFAVTAPEVEQPRADAFEVSPSGPLFGYKVLLAKGQAGLLEEALLEKEGVHLEAFRLGGGLDMEGERRPLRVPLSDWGAEADADGLLLSFALPAGSYATSVLAEVMKSETVELPVVADAPPAGDDGVQV